MQSRSSILKRDLIGARFFIVTSRLFLGLAPCGKHPEESLEIKTKPEIEKRSVLNLKLSIMRTLKEVAEDIRQDWKKVSPYAQPYLEAMGTLKSVNDNYYYDSGRDIVLRFLCNAQTWKGEVARRVKKELNDMLK